MNLETIKRPQRKFGTDGKVVKYSKIERALVVLLWKQKKKKLQYKRKTTYPSRQKFAAQRKRHKGRFVKNQKEIYSKTSSHLGQNKHSSKKISSLQKKKELTIFEEKTCEHFFWREIYKFENSAEKVWSVYG
jgi:hypothetical protein